MFMIIFMINPFTFSFFAPALDYFICELHSSQAHTIVMIYSFVFILIIGPSLIALVIYLDEKSFKQIFEGHATSSEADPDENGLIVETITTTEGNAGID
jgi:ABC-type glutathione transport system ATPase component